MFKPVFIYRLTGFAVWGALHRYTKGDEEKTEDKAVNMHVNKINASPGYA